MYSFLKAFLVLMKLLSLSQFYAPKYTRCVSGLCRIAWNYFQLQQNCLYDF